MLLFIYILPSDSCLDAISAQTSTGIPRSPGEPLGQRTAVTTGSLDFLGRAFVVSPGWFPLWSLGNDDRLNWFGFLGLFWLLGEDRGPGKGVGEAVVGDWFSNDAGPLSGD